MKFKRNQEITRSSKCKYFRKIYCKNETQTGTNKIRHSTNAAFYYGFFAKTYRGHSATKGKQSKKAYNY